MCDETDNCSPTNAALLFGGATVTPSLPASGNPVSGTFDWTTAAADAGDHVVLFVATDQCGARRECGITLRVSASSNHDPDCSTAAPNVATLWPPNHRLVAVAIDGSGDGTTCSDAVVVNGSVQVRAERSGKDNGHVYHIAFTATDGHGGSCNGKHNSRAPDLRILGLNRGVAHMTYSLAEESEVRLAVYSITGRLVTILVSMTGQRRGAK